MKNEKAFAKNQETFPEGRFLQTVFFYVNFCFTHKEVVKLVPNVRVIYERFLGIKFRDRSEEKCCLLVLWYLPKKDFV